MDKLVIDDPQSFKTQKNIIQFWQKMKKGQDETFSPLKKSIITKIQHSPLDEKADSLLPLHQI